MIEPIVTVTRRGAWLPLAAVLTLPLASSGCGSGETTVIEPQTYELTEQEQANRERAQKILAEQRQ